MELSKLKLNKNNPQKFDDLSKLENSIKEFPKMMELRPLIYDAETFEVLGGNKRLICLQNLGFKEIPDNWAKSADKLTAKEKKRFIIADNISFGDWDNEILKENWDVGDLNDWGIDIEISDISLPPDEEKIKDAYDGVIIILKMEHKTYPLIKEKVNNICEEYGIEADIS